MDGGIIIATEDNTDIFLNGAGLPVATLNEGDYYRILNNQFINQGGHFNIYVSTSKKAYLYQLIGYGSTNNSGSFNLVPPLHCFLRRKIDEIALVNSIPGVTVPVASKLNIITEAGASILVNGIPPTATQGPFVLTGNTQYVTYSVDNITNNINVTSTKGLITSIYGGYNLSGLSIASYGSYYTQYNLKPEISKSGGDCIPGINLQVDEGYAGYQWNLNGIPIPGATSNTFTPNQAGEYTVTITASSCTPLTTSIYKVFTCLFQTSQSLTLCEGVASSTVTPAFTSSTQTPVASTVNLVSAPSNGTATINPVNGVITYTPNVGFTGNDTFIYKFCGNAPVFVDCEQVTVNVSVSAKPIVNDVTIRSCFIESNPSTASFNLTLANVTSTPGVIKEYYPSLNDANNGTNQISPANAYISTNGTVFIKVINSSGCFRIAQVTLTVLSPVYSDVLADQIICPDAKTTLDAGSGFSSYTWSTGATTPQIIVGVGNYWVDLKTGDCITRQHVKVTATVLPKIKNITVSGTSITITAEGGLPPYQYSLDNVYWQSSNTFNDLPRGLVKVFLKDSYDCTPVIKEVTIENIINAITPNGDGRNDSIDYSALSFKNNFNFNVYDRYGTTIFRGSKENGYKWTGHQTNGSKVPTGTYWYELSWDENPTNIKHTGWLLVKNRD